MSDAAEGTLILNILLAISLGFALAGVILWFKARKRPSLMGMIGLALVMGLGLPVFMLLRASTHHYGSYRNSAFGPELQLLFSPPVIIVASSVSLFALGLSAYLDR